MPHSNFFINRFDFNAYENARHDASVGLFLIVAEL